MAELNTVSQKIDEQQSSRLSLPSLFRVPTILKKTRSSSSATGPQVPATIPEIEFTDEIRRTSSVKSQHSAKSNVRNYQKQNSVNNNNNSYENGAYDGPLPLRDRGDFDDRSNYSNRSSRNPSVQSLQVQREQYCCTKQWSTCEKRLAVSVAVLASAIVVLVIVIGLLAGNDTEGAGGGIRQNFIWHF